MPLLVAGLLLSLLSARAASNSLVRFTYYHGGVTVGSMDVELFDEEKPATVSNFLHYVRSGAYDNLMLHRMVTGFVMQAGALRSPDPLSTAPYAGSYYTPNFGRITNEFDVGPRYSNVVGTLAMARAIPSRPAADLTFEERVEATNSASTDWFINLGDNSGTLDTNWGGFTVFGRVVAGTNLLGFFNRTGPALSTTQVGFLFNLPVAYAAQNPPRYPRYADLYHVRIAEFPVATDVTRPKVAITYPAQGARLTNLADAITGTASDNTGVSSLWYAINSIDFTNIPAGNTWSIPARFRPGTNYVWVQSVDRAGQRSPFAGRNWFVSYLEPLNLEIVGPGTVRGATNGQRIEVDRAVTLTAVPSNGCVFAGWNGTTNFVPSVARFLMFTNAQVKATFVSNPFPRVKGTYSGLFYNTNYSIQNGPFPLQPSGGLDLTVTDQGKVTGKLRILGRSLPFSGSLSAYGHANLAVPAGPITAYFRSGPTWSVVFDLDVNNPPEQVRGGYVWDGQNFTSALALERVRPGSSTNPSPYLGSYTLAIAPGTNSAQPLGWGHATAKVNAAGIASLVGNLADGTPFTHAAPLITASGLYPLYANPYADKGWLYGWLRLQAGQPGGDLQGPLVWHKYPLPLTKPYRAGFEFYPAVVGSRYTPPSTTNRVLNFEQGTVSLLGPTLEPAVTNQVSVGLNNLVTNLSPNKLSLVLTKPSGLFSGSLQPPGQTRLIPFRGVVLPSLGYGLGYYLSSNLSGRVYFGP